MATAVNKERIVREITRMGSIPADGVLPLGMPGHDPDLKRYYYDPDKAHPGKKGSYIYACVLYAVLTGTSPIGLTHRVPNQPEGTITPAEARKFQEAAWRVSGEFNRNAAPSRP